jgi:hypothetical protein
MAEKITRVRRRRASRSFRHLGSFFQRQSWPARLALLVAGFAFAVALGVIFSEYGVKLYTSWHETQLLHRAASMLRQDKFNQAGQTAREVLQRHSDSLPALHVLAEATEKQNLEETILWRAQIAR